MIQTAYWWRGVPNFGDLLTPLLLRHFADIDVAWAPADKADLIGVGSILEHVPADWAGKIVGSGRLHPEPTTIPAGAEVLALRGPLSAAGVPGDYALGDPGLLANELVHVETKRFRLGLVPHWSDKDLIRRPEFSRYSPVVIDPRDNPLDVIRTIGECHKIVSSSLHGIILADAFAIPRRFEYTPQFDREGGTFKFQDYSASIATPFEVGKTIQASRFAVNDRKSELYDVFRALA